MKIFSHMVGILALVFSACAASAADKVPDLPEAVANNAVAKVTLDGTPVLLSFMGLGQNKDWMDVHANAYAYKAGAPQWEKLPPVPSSLSLQGRLASVAVGVGPSAYIFGGYTVAEDHTEISSPDNFRFDIETKTYTRIAPMPVPVDDAVAVVYEARFIYLISGWHNDGNVNLVQVYDIQTDRWFQASPFPGSPVFGQAGGIVNNVLLVCDGVKVDYHPDKRRGFSAEPRCYRGEINVEDPSRINWFTEQHPTATARYRMAATGIADAGKIIFIGGAVNPYNYNGIGYNGEPALATNAIWVYDIATLSWDQASSQYASMDHRGLIQWGDSLLRIGGMINPQRVSDKILTDNLNEY